MARELQLAWGECAVLCGAPVMPGCPEDHACATAEILSRWNAAGYVRGAGAIGPTIPISSRDQPTNGAIPRPRFFPDRCGNAPWSTNSFPPENSASSPWTAQGELLAAIPLSLNSAILP